MFEDTLLDSGNRPKTHRGAATLVSFILQACLLGVVILIPLLFTETLPTKELVTLLVAPSPPPPPPPPPLAASAAKVRIVRTEGSDIANGQLSSPTAIPTKIKAIKEETGPPSMGDVAGVVGGVPGGIPGGSVGGVIGGIISTTAAAAVVPKLAPTIVKRVRITSGVSQGLCLEHPQPEYPPLARQARIHGQVVLEADIGTDGLIHNLQVISGHPLLAPAAIEAVKHWRYRPYVLNGEAVEVKTTVTVNFALT